MQLAPFARYVLASALLVSLAACGGSGDGIEASAGGSSQAGGLPLEVAAGEPGSPAVVDSSAAVDTPATVGSSVIDAPVSGSAAGPVAGGEPSTNPTEVASEGATGGELTAGPDAALGTDGASAGSIVPPVPAGPLVSTDEPPTEPPVAYARKVPMKGPVFVPTTYTGMHAHRWPGGASPAPTYSYGTVRSLNYDPADNLGILWYGIHKGEHQYDWSKMDQWVETHHSAGKQLMYTLYGTPAYCSSNMSQRDPYNRLGGDRMPSSLTCVQQFIDSLVRRYNGDGVRRIQYIEIWNEPTFGGIPYWRDSASDLARLGRTVYQTAKAADSGVKVLWPSFVEWYSGVSVWADNIEYGNASDGVGGTGKDWADGFAFHFYSYSTNMNSLMNNQESVLKTLEALGKTEWETYNTEMGFGDGYAASLSTEVKATLVKRWMALSAAYGNKVAILYSHDGSNLGSPATNDTMAEAMEELHHRLVGKTIRDAGVLEDGRVFIVFGDNSTWLL